MQPTFTQMSQDNAIQSPPITAIALQPHSSLQSAPITAIALQPGHHILKPSRSGSIPCGITVTPVTSSVPTCTCSNSPGFYESPVVGSPQAGTR